MDYSGFGVLALKAIQEQQKIIDGLKNEIDQINSSNLFEVVRKQQEVINQLLLRIEGLEKKWSGNPGCWINYYKTTKQHINFSAQHIKQENISFE